MSHLTPILKETLDYLIAYHKKWSFMPTLSEIGDAMRVTKQTANWRLDRLSDEGYIKVIPFKSRAIIILKRK